MKNTAKPWIVTPSLSGENYTIVSRDSATTVIGSGLTKGNANHIVACVNACEGINPKAVPDLLEACKLLLEDCEMALANEWDRSDAGFEDSSLVLRSALIKALGEKRFWATQTESVSVAS
jgi:hypothetical protein